MLDDRPIAETDRKEPSPVETVDIGTKKQLLVDGYVLAESVRVTRTLGRVQKENNGRPVLVADKEPEQEVRIGFYLTALKAKDLFQMWYLATSHDVAYAESKDGIHWDKPNVRGGNNHVAVEGHGFSCIYDAAETDPEHRYKGAAHLGKVMACLLHSPDGIRWTAYNEGDPVTGRAGDTHSQIVWDPMEKRYLLFTRQDFGAAGGAGEVRGTRIMRHTWDNDLENHPTAWETMVKLRFDREGPEEAIRRQLYAMTDWIHEGIHFGLLSVFNYPVHDASYRNQPDLEKRHEKDVLDFYLATSRNAVDWDFHWVYADRPFIPRGGDGEYDKDGVRPSSNIITHKDRHWMYYGGMQERHGCAKRRMAIGLASWPLDRFVGYRAEGESGHVTTKPFRLAGKSLDLNLDAREGVTAVEVLDADAGPVPGYGAVDAEPLRGADGIRLRTRWKQHEDLSALKGRTVRLKFSLQNATLYSFQVRE